MYNVRNMVCNFNKGSQYSTSYFRMLVNFIPNDTNEEETINQMIEDMGLKN